MNHQAQSYNPEQLQQIITNAIHSALQASGKTSTEAVSTASSYKPDVEAMSKRACEARLKMIAKQYKP